MTNKFQPHLHVLPEDDANRQIANGFGLNIPSPRALRVLTEAGGWARVGECFASDHVSAMDKYKNRFMILLVDFDDKPNRLSHVKKSVPDRLQDRVFILGAFGEPEDLHKAGLGTPEEIGSKLADDCRDGTGNTWAHDFLKHNQAELARLRDKVCGFLFADPTKRSDKK
jgi:hypothetical protein